MKGRRRTNPAVCGREAASGPDEEDPMKRLTPIAVALTLGALLAAGPRAAAQDPKPAPAVKNIDLAICLDISGSMQGLIGSARAKLWDIVNELARVKPAPNLRVALFSYGSSRYPRENGW